MLKKMGSGIMLTVVLVSMFTVAFNITRIVADSNLAVPNHKTTIKTNEWVDFEVDGDSAELLVGLDDTQVEHYEELVDLITKSGGKIVNKVSMGGKIEAVVADIPFVSTSSFVTGLKDAGVSKYVEPNMKYETKFVPNDPYWVHQWSARKIEADFTWNTTIGDPAVLVAVIDTGIDWDHPDLAANYVALGYDWVNNDPDPMDDEGHGTHCAGIIAAVLNNSIGIAGLAQVHIMSEKALGHYGGGYADDLANAIAHAVDQGAHILSMSWGGYSESALIYEAVKYAYDNDVLMVAAAGNEATNAKLYPAGYDEVIAVSATQEDDNKWRWTNFGDWIELAAPGVEIFSTVWDDSYTYMSGTSMATPHIAGVAALVWSWSPNMTRDWVRLWLRYTADDLGDPGFDVYYGYGRINARKAVELAPPDHDLLILDWEKPPYVEPNNMAAINTTILNFGSSDESNIRVQLLVNGVPIDSTRISLLVRGAYVTVSFSWTPTSKGEYRVESYIVPVPYETITENNVIEGLVYVGFPIKAVVLDSAGTDFGEVVSTWETLNAKWPIFGTKLIHVDYTTLNIDDITYYDIAATEADVLIISCAFNWEFTDSEINAIKRYVYEGHGLISTAGTFYSEAPNNNKLAPLFGLNEAASWEITTTDLLHMLDQAHPLFKNIPDPYTFPEIPNIVPSDGEWSSNELSDGTYLALGHYKESAIVLFRGLVYISPWLEIIPAYYHFHLQLLYNAITWSSYQKPQHELVVSLESPPYLEPGEPAILNATVSNHGLSNEYNVELQLMINGTVVKSRTFSTLLTGESHTIEYIWTPAEGIYNVTTYAPPVTGETFTLNNVDSAIVSVRFIQVALISDDSELVAITPILDSMGIGYEIYDGNAYYLYTEDLSLLLGYPIVIFDNYDRLITSDEHSALESYLSSGGKLLVTGYDSLGNPDDELLANIVRSSTYGDDMGEPDLYVRDPTHPIMNGPYGIFLAGHHISDLSSDNDAAEADTGRGAVTVAELADGYDKIIATETTGGKIVYWNGAGPDDWIKNEDCEAILKNTISWFFPYEHELSVSLEAPIRLQPGDSSLLNATVHNYGLSDESNVELQLMINDNMVSFTAVPNLLSGTSYTINYYWTPAEEALYNVTAYTPPLPQENFTANNIVTRFVAVKPVTGYVLFDQTHGTDSIIEYSVWIANLTSRGYLVDTCKSTPITLTVLAEYDVFVIPQAFDRYSPTELEAIRNFVYGGGGILVIGDDEPVIYTDLTGFAGISWFSNGMSGTTTDLTPHEVTRGVASVYLESPIVSMEVTGMAQELVRDPAGGIMLAISEPGGRIIGFADENSLWDYSIVEANNLLLANNMIDWLLGVLYKHDLAVFLEAPSHLEPSESTLLNATVLNRGLSNETDVRLQLLINETLVEYVEFPQLLTGCSSDTLSYFWIAPTVEGVYNITAYAPPVSGENFTLNNVRSLMVLVQTLPNIIIVADNDGSHMINGTSLPEFESVVTAMGYDYYVWNESAMGNPSLDFLINFELVIWTCGDYYSTAVDSEDAETLQLYLASGGNILLEGEDIAYNHHDDSFMINVAHAIYQVDNTEAPGLVVSNLTHPLTLGLPTSFTWLTDPPYDDGVYPTNGGAEVIKYTGTNWTAVTVFKGANNGSVVYYAFPLYCLAQSERETLAFNSINWLLPTIEGDLNNDGVVNILDLLIVAFAFGAYPGHPRWNPTADFDGNGIINILDMLKIAKNFGETI